MTRQRFQFHLRHLFWLVTLLCLLLGASVVFVELAFGLAVAVIVGAVMAGVSGKIAQRCVVVPVFALAGGFGCFLLGMVIFGVAGRFFQTEPKLLIGLCAFFLPISGVVIGGWYGGWLERTFDVTNTRRP